MVFKFKPDLGNKMTTTTFNLSNELNNHLNDLALHYKTNKAEIMRQLIQQAYDELNQAEILDSTS